MHRTYYIVIPTTVKPLLSASIPQSGTWEFVQSLIVNSCNSLVLVRVIRG
jgi:hypothetical protein